jgi:hypothetical protein
LRCRSGDAPPPVPEREATAGKEDADREVIILFVVQLQERFVVLRQGDAIAPFAAFRALIGDTRQEHLERVLATDQDDGKGWSRRP